MPSFCSSSRGQHGDELAGTQPAGATVDPEMHRHRLVAIGKAGALISQRQHAPRARLGDRGLVAGQGIEAQGFDPQSRRLHDLKQDGARLRHLPGDGVDFRDDAGDRGGQCFRLSPHAIECAAAVFETLQLDAGFIELDVRDHAFLRQRLESGDTTFDETDLLVELALPLAHVRYVDRLHRWCHIGEDVALIDARAEPREAGLGRGKPPAGRSLDISARVGIGDDPSRQFDRAVMNGACRDVGADGKQALRRLGDEQRSVCQPFGEITLAWRCSRQSCVIVALVCARCRHDERDQDREQQGRRSRLAAAQSAHHQGTENETAYGRADERRIAADDSILPAVKERAAGRR